MQRIFAMKLLKLRLLLFSAFLPLICGQTTGFLSCLLNSTPAFSQVSPEYEKMTRLSFVNNRAKPAAIVLTQTVSEVIDAVHCARVAGLRVCARSGGHSQVGKSLCAGVVVDVGPMRRVTVLPDGTADVQAGATLGEMMWTLHERGRWFAAGICPAVGVAGYVLGGGHGPYEGRLGVACDALREVTLVNRNGTVIVASNEKHRELFWGLCGAGGSQFGIVTSFKIQTVDSGPFDRSVVFRFNWKQEHSGEAVAKWMDYDEDGGNVWFRMEQNMDAPNKTGMNAFGACYEVSSVDECLTRLNKAEFFRVRGRSLVYAAKTRNALDTLAFMGPEGDWGNFLAKDLQKAMLEQRYGDAGQGNDRIQKAAFLTVRTDRKPTVDFWQRYSEFCANSGLKSIPWVVCQIGLFKNAVNIRRNNAFPHRGADIIQYFFVGGGTKADKVRAYRWMEKHLRNYTSGVYLNYPELELGDAYPSMYWGQNLARLRILKRVHDPDIFFSNPQPIPPGQS